MFKSSRIQPVQDSTQRGFGDGVKISRRGNDAGDTVSNTKQLSGRLVWTSDYGSLASDEGTVVVLYVDVGKEVTWPVDNWFKNNKTPRAVTMALLT